MCERRRAIEPDNHRRMDDQGSGARIVERRRAYTDPLDAIAIRGAHGQRDVFAVGNDRRSRSEIRRHRGTIPRAIHASTARTPVARVFAYACCCFLRR